MKIPLYTSNATASNQAPGSSITARKNAQPFVNAALAKAKVADTALSAVGQYAKHRFEVSRDNLLNEANLGIQEELYTRSRELADSDDIDNVLDGDSPLWNQEVQRITDKYKKTIRNDEYSQNTFNLKSKQTEMQHRFWLRDQVDQKIDVKSVNNYVLGVKQLEDRLGTYDITEQEFILERNRIVNEGNDLLKKGLVKPGSIEDTIYNLTKTLARKTINDFITRNPNRELQTLDAVRRLVRDNPGIERTPDMIGNPEEAALMNELRYPLTLLRDLDPVDQAQVLGNTDSTIMEIFGPTLQEIADGKAEKAANVLQKALDKEKKAASKAQITEIKNQTKDIASVISGTLTEGYKVDDDTLQTIYGANDLVKGLVVTPENEDAIKDFNLQITNLEIAQTLNKSFKKLSPSEIALEIREFYNLGEEKLRDPKFQFAIKFAQQYQKKFEAGIADDPINYFANLTKGDIGKIDLSLEGLQDRYTNNPSIKKRITVARLAEEQFEMSDVVYLTSHEASMLKDQFNDGSTAVKMDILGGLERLWGTAAPDIFKQLGFNDAQFSQIANLYSETASHDTLKRILRGIDKEKEKTSIVDATLITPMFIAQEFNDKFSEVFPSNFYSEEDIGAIQTNVRYYLLSGTKPIPGPSDVRDAIFAVTGRTPQGRGGIQMYEPASSRLFSKKGNMFLAPDATTGRQISKALDYFNIEALQDQDIDTLDLDPDLLQEVRDGAFTIMLSHDNKYLLLEGDAVVSYSDGQPLLVDLFKLVNHMIDYEDRY